MALELRPITRDELEAFQRCMAVSFGFVLHDEDMARREAIFEFDRSLAAFEDGQVVGTANAFTYGMGVPGGTIPTAGVTMVSVRPTHRRQGILRSIMARQLADVRARGEPVAALWASESAIYGRFGYGLAAETDEWEIERTRAALGQLPEVPGRVRHVEKDEAREQWPATWEAVQRQTPGMMTRSADWWSLNVFDDPESNRGGFTANVHVNYEEAGELRGYLRYRSQWGIEHGLHTSTLLVEELMALTPEAYAALWQYAFGVDLIAKITAPRRPPDEPLLHMLADPRRLIRHRRDSLWVRLLDVPRALAARRYAVSGELTIGVTDPFMPEVGGTFTLQGGPDGSQCHKSDEVPDIELAVADLGAIYLGGTRLGTLARTGRVRASEEVIRRADAMFSWDRAPWCPEVF